MKVLNLCCTQGHGFEGWFASEDDFLAQNNRGAVECPLCADTAVTRLPSAPRLNLSRAREPERTASATQTAAAPPAGVDLQARWLQAVQHALRHTEDVGDRFPEEARRIHYGETAQRGIRGQASDEDRAALADEGIEVMTLPLPAAVKGSAH